MSTTILQFLASAIVIVVAACFLTRFADTVAKLSGFGHLLVGSVLLASVTSLPELVIDFSAVRIGASNLAVGDLLGSNIFNLLILAVLDLCHRSPNKMLSRSSAAHALNAMLSIGLTAIVCLSIALAAPFSTKTLLGVGMGPLFITVIYLLGIRLVHLDHKVSKAHAGPETAGVAGVQDRKDSLRGALLGIALSGAAIVGAGPFLASSASSLAEQTGVGQSFMGSSLVALSTSLPELVTSLVAVRMGAFELAVGNIFGSNAFNMLILLPLDLAAPGSLLSTVSHVHLVTGLCTIGITCVAVAGLLFHEEKRRTIVEPDALLVIVLCIASLVLLYAMRG